MITLEAFINRKNLKKAVDANNGQINYDDIRFHNAMKGDCDELLNRIKENDLLPNLKTVEGKKVTGWRMTNRGWTHSIPLYPVLEVEYEGKYRGNVKVNGSRTYIETKPLMHFILENKDDDFIAWCDSYTYYEKPSEELENELKECDKIAKAMGFIHYTEKWGRWYKNKEAIK